MNLIAKLLAGFLLIVVLATAGCGGGGGGVEGDTNDPAVSGDDAAQMNEQEGDVDTSASDQ